MSEMTSLRQWLAWT